MMTQKKSTTSLVDDPLPLPVHEAAEVFDLLDGQAFDDLVEDIRRYGQRDPIVTTSDGKILDGRNRHRACLVAGIEPTFRIWDGESGTELQYVVSVNWHRRHLTTSQRALAAAKIATLEQGARTDLPQNCGTSQSQAADKLKVSVRSVQSAKKVLDRGTPELVQAVRAGVISVDAASAATELPPDAQRDVVRSAKSGIKPTAALLKKKAHTPKSTIEAAVTLPPPPPSTYEWVDARLSEARSRLDQGLSQVDQSLKMYMELDATAPGLKSVERRTVRDRLQAARRRLDASVTHFGGKHKSAPDESRVA